MPKRQGNNAKQVLVVYKPNPSPSKRIPAHASRAHVQTLEHLYHLLHERYLPFRAIPLEQLGPIYRARLVITVGGDGTVLATSHYVNAQPILGVKSFGETSVGHFCAATEQTLARVLDGILAGKHRPMTLSRLEVRLDGHTLHEQILNDCLFAHSSPAAISDYRLTISGTAEVQRSSGLWISTAAGSTAAIMGAGGRRMPLQSKKMQYRIREPYISHHPYQLRGGLIPPTAVITIESYTNHGTLSIDGAHIQYPVPEGSIIRIRRSRKPLRIYWR